MTTEEIAAVIAANVDKVVVLTYGTGEVQKLLPGTAGH
jgi:hypothetical protein